MVSPIDLGLDNVVILVSLVKFDCPQLIVVSWNLCQTA